MFRTEELIRVIREVYPAQGNLPLHAPIFNGNEAKYVASTIESTFVSSVGAYVDQFEAMLRDLTGAKTAVALSNGTSALYIALLVAGVKTNDLVLTQSLTFVATANAIKHTGANPVFLDVDRATLGLSPDSVEAFLEKECEIIGEVCVHKSSGKRVSACVPMHTFGLACRIEALHELCQKWHILLIEDAAESLGSTSHGQHCGTFGLMGTLSFNGNKICTTGGGGAILTNDLELGKKVKHITTTAKIPHAWKFQHDMTAFNFRLPNLNAALGCAQLERLPHFIEFKRALAKSYDKSFQATSIEFILEPANTESNYWLNAVLASSLQERDDWLEKTNAIGIMTRPVWEPMHELPMYCDDLRDDLAITIEMASRIINIPSGVQATLT
jgi:aminotransferase in exopolysaccharide biosynthesis